MTEKPREPNETDIWLHECATFAGLEIIDADSDEVGFEHGHDEAPPEDE